MNVIKVKANYLKMMDHNFFKNENDSESIYESYNSGRIIENVLNSAEEKGKKGRRTILLFHKFQ